MFDVLKKTLLASLGAIAFNKDRLKSFIDDLVARGDLSREQGKRVFDDLVRRGQEESEEISDRIYGELLSFRDLLPASRREVQRLEARVAALEEHTGTAEGAGSQAESGDSDRESASDASCTELPVEHSGEALSPSDEN